MRFGLKISICQSSMVREAQMLQVMACSAVIWSQLHLPSHLLINNF